MSISTSPARFEPTEETARRNGRVKAAFALILGGLGVLAALFLEDHLDSRAPAGWSGAEFGRALAQYRRFAWFDALETALESRAASTRRDSMIGRFPTADQERAPLATHLHLDITIAPRDLSGPDGVLTHASEKGDAWERPALARLFKNGVLLKETRAGFRIHGGTGRDTSSSSSDFRLYFREAYEAEPPEAEALWPDIPQPVSDGRLERIVAKSGISNGVRNHIALVVSKRLGVLAPESAFASIRVNGGKPAFGLLLEHLSPDWLDSRFGHRDFIFRRLKGGGRRGRGTLYLALEQRVNQLSSLSLADVAPHIDMPSLARQYAATLITRTQDPFQGAILFDRRDPNAKWHFVAWDMEGAFPRSQLPDYPRHLGYPPGQTPILRAVLWRKLLSDPDFQTLMRDTFQESKARLNDDWIDALQNRLLTQAVTFPEAERHAAREEILRAVALLREARDSIFDVFRDAVG